MEMEKKFCNLCNYRTGDLDDSGKLNPLNPCYEDTFARNVYENKICPCCGNKLKKLK